MSTDIKLLGRTSDSTMATSRRQKTVQKFADVFDKSNATSRIVLTSGESKWEIISPEDVFVEKLLKSRIRTAILQVVDSIVTSESSGEGGESEDDTEEEGTVKPNIGHRRSRNVNDPVDERIPTRNSREESEGIFLL